MLFGLWSLDHTNDHRKRTHNPDPKLMESKQKFRSRPKPKLERRNAIKNINYEYDDSSSLRTRSLDLSAYSDNRTSLRIVGGSDGEIDRICLSLGLSGPEDFGIPVSAWEACKARSSSSPSSFPSRFYEPPQSSSKDGDDDEGGLSNRFEDELTISDEPVLENLAISPSPPPPAVSTSSSRGIIRGIKGVRPPLLAPPPVRLLPTDDNLGCSSTWDLLQSFGPPPDNNYVTRASSSTSSSEDENEQEVVMRLGETDLHLSESCSFSTSHDGDDDGDSSSSTTDPTYIISPNGIVRYKRNINSWYKGNLLGSGSFGTVYEGLSDDGFFFAVKEVSLLDQGNQAKQSIYQLEQEISLLSQFEHENIVQYLGTQKDEEKLYIFLELVTQGSLAKLYQRYHLADAVVSSYTRQILHGLKYLHDRNVVHRDIKCANILVDANGSVKLADFGLAKATKLNDVKSCKGTAFWMAPEVVNRRNHGYGLPADIWSLGCTVLEMLTRQLPYSNLECMQALFRIGKGKPPPIPDSLTGAARDFIRQCLQVNVNDRPTAAQLLDHPFVDRPLSGPSGAASPLHNNWRRA